MQESVNASLLRRCRGFDDFKAVVLRRIANAFTARCIDKASPLLEQSLGHDHLVVVVSGEVLVTATELKQPSVKLMRIPQFGLVPLSPRHKPSLALCTAKEAVNVLMCPVSKLEAIIVPERMAEIKHHFRSFVTQIDWLVDQSKRVGSGKHLVNRRKGLPTINHEPHFRNFVAKVKLQLDEKATAATNYREFFIKKKLPMITREQNMIPAAFDEHMFMTKVHQSMEALAAKLPESFYQTRRASIQCKPPSNYPK